jgi:hypothetical protein
MKLYIGGKFTGVSIEADAVYPGMWRIRRGGRLSDMVNKTRAKDAAIAWARPRGLGGDETAQWHHRETAPRGSHIAPIEGAAPPIAEAAE